MSDDIETAYPYEPGSLEVLTFEEATRLRRRCDWTPDDLNPVPDCPYCAGDMCARFDGLNCRHDLVERHGYEPIDNDALRIALANLPGHPYTCGSCPWEGPSKMAYYRHCLSARHDHWENILKLPARHDAQKRLTALVERRLALLGSEKGSAAPDSLPSTHDSH